MTSVIREGTALVFEIFCVKCEAIRRTVLYVFCICSSLFPDSCLLTDATNDSLMFWFESSYSATSYRLVGHGVDEVIINCTRYDCLFSPAFTVNGLTPGSYYTFMVWGLWAVDFRRRHSNNVATCAGYTCMLRFVLSLHYGRPM